ncbi:phosphate acetyltransferase, partial [Francisella tularensis subsp. holarctica]|nr:phosphate acetyltransferase [Francisella tularensis subsp. holarctica]
TCAGILLTAEEYLKDKVKELCVETAEKVGLASLTTRNKSVKTILRIADIDLMGIPLYDKERIQRVKEIICNSLDRDKIISAITADV